MKFGFDPRNAKPLTNRKLSNEVSTPFSVWKGLGEIRVESEVEVLEPNKK